MKKILVVLCLIWMGTNLFGHAPIGLNLEYDEDTNLLSVEYKHRSGNQNEHFVYSVKIALNSEQIIEQTLSSQESTDGGSVIFKIIDLKPGDEIAVQIDCNKGGRRTQKLKIE